MLSMSVVFIWIFVLRTFCSILCVLFWTIQSLHISRQQRSWKSWSDILYSASMLIFYWSELFSLVFYSSQPSIRFFPLRHFKCSSYHTKILFVHKWHRWCQKLCSILVCFFILFFFLWNIINPKDQNSNNFISFSK